MVQEAPDHALRKWRLNAKKSQEWCAREVRVTRQTWITWELGKAVPSPASMRRILGLTGGQVSAADFYPQISNAA